jgi:phosphonate transport system ATP-binding protein
MLELKKITKTFGDTIAVNNVSLSFERGQMVGIIGRSGAGKSTLLRLINRLTTPGQGRIQFENTDVGALAGRELRAWRARCAMIFQQFNLVNRLDVLTNVLIGRIGTAGTLPVMFKHFSVEDRALAAMALDRLDLLPQALQRADTLSGGQQQRVAIAPGADPESQHDPGRRADRIARSAQCAAGDGCAADHQQAGQDHRHL